MNKELLKFISILLITLGLLTAYSFIPQTWQIASVTLNKTPIKAAIMGENNEEIVAFDSLYADSLATVADSLNTGPQMDSTSQRILLIGDSMLEGLRLRLQDYTEHNQHDMLSVIWYSSTTKWYGQTDTLDYFIEDYDPTYIMLVLGANELFIKNIKSRRDKYVKNILKKLAGRQFIWIGPPNWADDTGINELIEKNTGSDRYFPSKDLTYRRTDDGAHPTRSSAATWMDSICHWVMTESRYPILLETPDSTRTHHPKTTLLQPID